MDVIEPPAPSDPSDPSSQFDPAGPEGPAGLDLSPRPTPPKRKRRAWVPAIVIVLVLVGAGYVVSKALTSATLFFYNADEAVAKQSQLGVNRFRIQGTVEDDVRRTANGADFDITYKGVVVPVDHVGDPPALFKPGEPVVLEGHFASQTSHVFESDLMLVKHDANYVAKNSGRLKEAEKGGQVAPENSTPSTTTAPGGTPSSGTP
jgi:cytochrome c-type biogenesis protein CcmE